jgi:alpha-D-ribose 1-methylphosphonate 5-triphosphate synthase subunit PhnG
MTDMTPRQRWLAILNRQSVDRIPTDYWATAENIQAVTPTANNVGLYETIWKIGKSGDNQSRDR